MNPQSLWQLTVETSSEAEDAVSSLLERLYGESASVYVSEEDRSTHVTVYLPASTAADMKRDALDAGLRFIQDCGLDISPARITTSEVPPEDWSESWKKHFKLIEISDTLLIKPPWIQKRPAPGQVCVILDPGLSFGTGQHPTTHFCLEQIVNCRSPHQAQAFLDAGCGSGILAIAAAKLGYSPVHAFDHDPKAIQIAKRNASVNDAAALVSISQQDLAALPAGADLVFDVICANLLDHLLLAHLQVLLARLRPGGVLVAAGILESQFEAVEKDFTSAGLVLQQTQTEDEWKSGRFLKPS